MRKLLVVLLLCAPLQLWAQGRIPHEAELALDRIEHAFRSASPISIDDMLINGMTIRLEDSLYTNISSITAFKLLTAFFSDIDSVSLRLLPFGQGEMKFVRNGKTEILKTEVFLERQSMSVGIHALNISNYPFVTMFYRMNRHNSKSPH